MRSGWVGEETDHEDLSAMTRRSRRLVQVAIALIVGIIGVGGFFLVIPHTTVQSTKLDEFVVANPKLSRLVASPNQFTGVYLSHDPSPSIVAAAAADPAHTGAFSVEWFANGRDGTALDIYIETMPTNALTSEVFNTAKSDGISSAGLKKIDYDLIRQFGVSGIPGAAAASYKIVHTAQPGSTATPLPPTPAITVIFSKGHVVFAMQVASYLLNSDQVLALARAEYARVSAVLPTFTSLRLTADPPLGTGLWIGIAGAVFIVLVTLPWALESRNESRQRRIAARARYATRSRGSKVARRRGATR
jgi:hypothetical protein